MKDTRDPIQELLITARRNQILDAATKVFAKKGFHPTTIKDIAREAGIADGTIYNYFENKTALMLGILDRLNESDQRNEDFSKFTEVDFRSFMKAYLRHRLTVLQADNFEVFRVVISEIMVNKELRELYYRKIVEPTFYHQAKGHPLWEKAMKKEFDALASNNTWEIVPLPQGKHLIACKWVFKVKLWVYIESDICEVF